MMKSSHLMSVFSEWKFAKKILFWHNLPPFRRGLTWSKMNLRIHFLHPWHIQIYLLLATSVLYLKSDEYTEKECWPLRNHFLHFGHIQKAFNQLPITSISCLNQSNI